MINAAPCVSQQPNRIELRAITATNVRTRSPHVFRNAQINADVLLVFACLSLM
jgi:hypothetical protein